METWKDIEGFNGLYQVSDLGRVYSKWSNKVLKQLPRRHGYLSVWLYGNGEGISGRNGKAYSVHRLVAEAFCKKREGASEINHRNEDKTDNRAENLEWVTHKENSNYGTRNARLSAKGLNGKQSKKTYQYTLNWELVNEYPSVHEASRANGFGLGNICKSIANPTVKTAYGYRWTH